MFLEKFRVDGKIAIITGGTRGIGLSIAHALGEAGAKLVLTNRTDQFGGLESLKKAKYDVVCGTQNTTKTPSHIKNQVINSPIFNVLSLNFLINLYITSKENTVTIICSGK